MVESEPDIIMRCEAVMYSTCMSTECGAGGNVFLAGAEKELLFAWRISKGGFSGKD